MKLFKYLMVAALAIGAGTAAHAQESANKAVIDQVTNIVKSKAPDVAKQLKDIVKANKKNAEVLTAIGRAFLDEKDTLNATKYAEMAIKANKNYGNAYVLAGDIEVAKDNGGVASAWYEQACYFDPKNPAGYRRYAMVNSKVAPSAAVAKLEELRQQCPDYPVDLVSAEIYSKAGKVKQAIEYYGKVDLAKMEDYQLADYATLQFLSGDYNGSLKVALFGAQKFPTNAGLNRLAFYNNTELKNYADALTYADALFNKSEKAKFSSFDYLYKGFAHVGAQQYDEAIAAFQKSLEVNENNPDDRNKALLAIANAYKAKGDFAKAVEAYGAYMADCKQLTANDYNTLAGYHMAQSEAETDPAAKKECIMKADGIYGEIAEKFPSAAVFATYQRAHLAFTLDPETKEGLAKPHYEKLVELILAKSEKDDRDNTRLVESYRYLGYYYLLQDDKATADIYWNKVLEIDPNNETAKAALGAGEK